MKKDKLVFIGDSLIYGYGVKKSDNWVSKVEKLVNYDVINKGINGNTTTDMLDRFTNDIINNLPAIAFIMGGTNDLLSNRPVNSILKNIELMIKECIEAKIKVVIGIPPIIIIDDAFKLFSPSPTYEYFKNQIPVLRNDLLELCSKYNLNYVDFYTVTKNNLDKDIFNDGIHLNLLGQEIFTSEALKVLNSII